MGMNLHARRSITLDRLARARRTLALARLHNAAATDAGVPEPFPPQAIIDLEQTVIDLAAVEDLATGRTA